MGQHILVGLMIDISAKLFHESSDIASIWWKFARI